MDVLSGVGGVVGLLGGLAGLFAFYRQEQDRRHARNAPPDELRQVLVDLHRALETVARKPQTYDWVNQEIEPLSKTLGLIRPLLKNRLLQTRLNTLQSYSSTVLVHGSLPELTRSPEEVALNVQDQRKAARDGVELAVKILRELK